MGSEMCIRDRQTAARSRPVRGRVAWGARRCDCPTAVARRLALRRAVARRSVPCARSLLERGISRAACPVRSGRRGSWPRARRPRAMAVRACACASACCKIDGAAALAESTGQMACTCTCACTGRRAAWRAHHAVARSAALASAATTLTAAHSAATSCRCPTRLRSRSPTRSAGRRAAMARGADVRALGVEQRRRAAAPLQSSFGGCVVTVWPPPSDRLRQN